MLLACYVRYVFLTFSDLKMSFSRWNYFFIYKKCYLVCKIMEVFLVTKDNFYRMEYLEKCERKERGNMYSRENTDSSEWKKQSETNKCDMYSRENMGLKNKQEKKKLFRTGWGLHNRVSKVWMPSLRIRLSFCYCPIGFFWGGIHFADLALHSRHSWWSQQTIWGDGGLNSDWLLARQLLLLWTLCQNFKNKKHYLLYLFIFLPL